MDSIQNSFVWLSTVLSAILLGTSLADPVSATPFPQELKDSIKYVVILFPENRSFDSLFGKFPGANGIREAGASAKLQLKPAGEPFDPLPQPNTGGIPGIDKGPDPRFPTSLKDMPYEISQYVPEDSRQGDLVHRFYTEQYQINSKESRFAADPKNSGGGPMSKFAAWSDNPGLVTSYLNAHDLPEGRLARNYVLCDNAFHSAFGGSFLNHIWLIAARSPIWPAHPSEGSSPKPANATRLEDQGFPASDGVSLSDKALTNDPKLPGLQMSNAAQVLGEGDYWAVNTLLPLRGPAGGYQALTPAPLTATRCWQAMTR